VIRGDRRFGMHASVFVEHDAAEAALVHALTICETTGILRWIRRGPWR